MTTILPFIGITGAIILVCGAAYPIKHASHPLSSIKNWLFAVGGIIMLIYAVLNYLSGTGAVFYIFLQAVVNLASIFMMTNTREKISTPIILLLTGVLIIWSLKLSLGLTTLLFILGLGGIATGYVLKPGTARRNIALTLGSLLIVIFSYLVNDWVFFSLNSFFAIFSGYYSWKLCR